MVDWGDEEMFTAPTKEQRIAAAHMAPKIRKRDRLRAIAFSVRLGAWACWKYNRRLFWQLFMGLFGLLFIAGCLLSLIIRSVF